MPTSGTRLASIALLCASALEAQGFGMIKTKVQLNRRRPPEVYLIGTAIQVRVDAQSGEHAALAQRLRSLLEADLCRNDPRLRPENVNPETLIVCTITHHETGQKWESRREKEYRKTGERQEWNKSKQRYETRAVYGNVEVNRNYLIASGAINVTYQATEARAGHVLDSDTIASQFSREFLEGKGAPSAQDLELLLARGVVARVVPRLTPTVEPVEVWLAKGRLEEPGRLGQSGLWSRMLEKLETMPPFRRPDEDAYRAYDIGVAYEALAYQAEEIEPAKKLLEQASIHYGKAMEQKPDEKYFREPQVRIQAGITQYNRFGEQLAAYARAKGLEQPAAGASERAVGKPAGQTLTNQALIDLVKAGLDETNLLATISEAPAVQFDLAPQAQIELLRNKISSKVITAMRERQTGGKR